MERKLKPIYVQHALAAKGLRLFSPSDFERIFGVSQRAAQEFVKDHCDDIFLKARNGLYALRIDPPPEEAVANRLYAPSYVSFEYALARYGIIPESVYAVTSATTRTTREFIVSNKSFTYSHIKKQAFRGYRTEKTGGVTVLIAEPEKALVDYLYFVDLKRKVLSERLNVRKVKKGAVVEYARLFSRKSLMKLIIELLNNKAQ
jgi:predicted transcriptional regulator of viral defense system